MQLLIELISATIIIGVLDFVWLGSIAKKLYYRELGGLLRQKPNMIAAVAFYVIYVIGMVVFVINPYLNGPWYLVAGFGAVFGLVCYGTYDFTNLATLKGFSPRIVLIDLLWGVCLTAVAATGSYWVVTALG